MKDQEDDFFENIKKELKSQHEPYQEGAWEQFLLHEKRKPGKLLPLFTTFTKIAVAAAVIAAVGIFSYRYFTDGNSVGIETATPLAKEEKKDFPKSNTILDAVANPLNKEENLLASTETHITSAFTKSHHEKINPIIKQNSLIENAVEAVEIKKDSSTNVFIAKEESPKKENAIPQIKENTKPTYTPQNQQGLAEWAAAQTQQQSFAGSRWSPNLYIAPNMNDAGVNLSFGVGVDYAVNQKFKISTGIEYAKIQSEVNTHSVSPASITPNHPAMVLQDNTVNRAVKNTLTTPSSNYQINNTVTGINIPLSITYNVNNKIYATTGFSGLLVLENKGDINFTSTNNERISVSTNKGQIIEEKDITFSNTISGNDLKNYNQNSLSINSNLNTVSGQKNNSFIPFYNAAIGIKQAIGKKNSIALEPFIQVPLIQNNTTKYTGGGIRLKVNL